MAPTRRPASPPAPAPAAAAPPAPRPLPLQRALVRRRPRHRRRPLPLPILVRATAGPRVLVEVVAALGPRAPPAMSARRLARRRPPGPRRAPAEAAALDEDRVHLLGTARRAHRRRGHHHHGQRLLGRRRRLLRSRPLLPLLPSRRSVLGPHDEHRGLACGVRLPGRLGRPQTTGASCGGRCGGSQVVAGALWMRRRGASWTAWGRLEEEDGLAGHTTWFNRTI